MGGYPYTTFLYPPFFWFGKGEGESLKRGRHAVVAVFTLVETFGRGWYVCEFAVRVLL